MKTIFKNACIATVFVLLLSGLTGCFTTATLSDGEQYSNPSWAPPYYAGVRYYYLPDIETYYDLTNQDFVYLDNGQWLFSNTLPSMYSGYDLYNGFEIALDIDVYQPWMHHHFYVSHYPRYYYHSLYRNAEAGSIRGFNENERKPFYSSPQDKGRRTELSKTFKTENNVKITRPSQKVNYYGRNIGQHVRVQPQMRQSRQPAQRNTNVQRTQGGNQGHERR